MRIYFTLQNNAENVELFLLLWNLLTICAIDTSPTRGTAALVGTIAVYTRATIFTRVATALIFVWIKYICSYKYSMLVITHTSVVSNWFSIYESV